MNTILIPSTKIYIRKKTFKVFESFLCFFVTVKMLKIICTRNGLIVTLISARLF